jgi:hypothetical protein
MSEYNQEIASKTALEIVTSLNNIPKENRIGFLYGLMIGFIIKEGINTPESIKTCLEKAFDEVATPLQAQYEAHVKANPPLIIMPGDKNER